MSATFAQDLTVHPARPTSADLVEIRAGGGGLGQPDRVFRSGTSNIFFEQRTSVPVQATYSLGALLPGVYEFHRYENGTGPACGSFSLIDVTTFTVRPATEGVSSGVIELVVKLTHEEAARELVERENPSISHWFGSRSPRDPSLGSILLNPGMEEDYRYLLMAEDRIQSVDWSAIESGGCHLFALDSPHYPGKLRIAFEGSIDLQGANVVVRRQLPELERFDPSPASFPTRPGGLARIRVLVPTGWEALLVERYKRYPDVIDATILDK